MKITRDTAQKLEHAPPFIRLLSSILIYILFLPLPPPKNLGYYFIPFVRFPSFPVRSFPIDPTNPRDWSSQTRFGFVPPHTRSKWNTDIGGRRTVFTVNEIFTRYHVEIREACWTLGRFNFTIDDRKLRFVSNSVKARLKRNPLARICVHARMLLWYFPSNPSQVF